MRDYTAPAVSQDSTSPNQEPGSAASSDAPTSNAPADAAADAEAKLEESTPDPLAAAQAETAKLRDQLLRTMADFDNYRKRSRRETQDAEKRAKEDVIRDLLPVFDNFERAAQHAESAADVKSLAEGVAMVMRIFLDTLSKLGVERIVASGTPFDPALHEAVQQIETEEHPPGSVVTEITPGYKMGERLLRPAMVIVAKPPRN